MCNSLQTIGLLEQAEQPKEKWDDITGRCDIRLYPCSLVGGKCYYYLAIYCDGFRVAYMNDNSKWCVSDACPSNVRFLTNPEARCDFRVEERVA